MIVGLKDHSRASVAAIQCGAPIADFHPQHCAFGNVTLTHQGHITGHRDDVAGRIIDAAVAFRFHVCRDVEDVTFRDHGLNLTKTAACDLGQYNVRVNAVCPGLIETGMTKPVFDYARDNNKEQKLGSRCELRRYGRPEEIAAAMAFLASDDASYITGQAPAVDGGNTASLNLPGMKH